MKTHSRLNNLLGALAVHLNDSIRDSTAKAAGHDASAPAALVQIGSFTGESLAHTVEGLHELSANLFFGLLLLHLAGAILHRLKNKDSIFRRIMPF